MYNTVEEAAAAVIAYESGQAEIAPTRASVPLSGHRGVTKTRTGRWQAFGKKPGVSKRHIGMFDTLEDAAAAVIAYESGEGGGGDGGSAESAEEGEEGGEASSSSSSRSTGARSTGARSALLAGGSVAPPAVPPAIPPAIPSSDTLPYIPSSSSSLAGTKRSLEVSANDVEEDATSSSSVTAASKQRSRR